jgi:RNA polymerase sigma-32 factor
MEKGKSKNNSNNKSLPAPYTGRGVSPQLSPLQLYLREIARYPLLSPEEEFELAKRHHDEKDPQAAHRLITSNLRLVVKIASDLNKAQMNLLDLVQEGTLGLMQAVKKFDPYKGVKLSSYAAWWIRAYILKYLLENRSQVRIATTTNQRKLFYNLQKETNRLLAEGEDADVKLIADSLDVPEKDVIEMQKRLNSSDVSLDAPIYIADGSSSPTTYGEQLSDDSQVSVEVELSKKQIRVLFEEYLEEFEKTLKGRDLEIFHGRILADNPKTLQEIGEDYGISRERARQLEARILSRLEDFVREKGTFDI